MDYLISQGYPHAAQKFATEANMRLTSDVNSITQRVEIRDAIHSGDIQTALERINEMNPQVGLDMPSRRNNCLLAMMLSMFMHHS